MPTSEHMTKVVQAYVAAFAKKAPDEAISLFAEDGVIIDPVGSEPKVGRAAIREHYDGAMATGAKLTLDGPVRAVADCAAFAFHVDLAWEGQSMRFDVIDIFRFNKEGLVQSMEAYFSPANISRSA